MTAHNRPGSSSLRPSTLLIGFAFIFLVWYTTFSSSSTTITTTYSTFITMTSTGSDTGSDTGTDATSSNTHHNAIDISSSLNVSSRQTGTSPPRITFGVTNNSSRPLTILSWDTPLDPLALQLGYVTLSVLTPAADENRERAQPKPKPLDLPTIQIRRKMPPGPDALVTIEPGATAENDVVLREALVPPEKLLEIAAAGAKLAVACRGRWTTVWPGKAEDVTEEMRKELGGGGSAVLTGAYESEPLVIEINPAEL